MMIKNSGPFLVKKLVAIMAAGEGERRVSFLKGLWWFE